jgi:signal transduction histidine kinase/HAMP domain-containing protein
VHFAPWRTIRGRLVLAALVIELVMLAILVGNSLRLLREAMGDQAREQAEQIAPVLSAALVAPLAQSDYATVQAVLKESHAIRGIDYLAVTDASGAIVATSGWPIGKPLPRIDANFSLDDDDTPPRYDLALPIQLAGQTLGRLQLGLDLSRIVVARGNLLQQGLLIAAGEMLLSLGLLLGIGHLITRQLSLLTTASLAVAQGQLTPAPVAEGQDDVGRLGAAFNTMSRAIAERVEQLTLASEEKARIAKSLQERNTQLEHSHAALHTENGMRIEAQRELEVALGHIRDHTAQLNAIFDLSPDGFVSFDAEGCVTFASPAFFEMVGLEAGDVIGLDESTFSAQLAAVCAEQAPFPGIAALKKAAAEAPATGSGRNAARDHRQLIELAGPGKTVLELGLRLSEAKTVSQILFFRDVTHETEVDRVKSEFLSHAAHELRTPMASIYGFTELLLTRKMSDEKRHDLLSIIRRQSELMVSIINELLDLVRIDDRRGQDFDFAALDLGAVVREVTSDFGVPAGQQAAELDLPDLPCTIRADRKKLMQAVRNILSNAYKYSPSGGQVSIGLVRGGSDVADRIGVRVTDHGIGMTPQQAARVCERFYRADVSGSIPGTGLGMSIVKEIIALHGGEMQIDSELGRGTTVTLWLPLAAAAEQPRQPALAAA